MGTSSSSSSSRDSPLSGTRTASERASASQQKDLTPSLPLFKGAGAFLQAALWRASAEAGMRDDAVPLAAAVAACRRGQLAGGLTAHGLLHGDAAGVIPSFRGDVLTSALEEGGRALSLPLSLLGPPIRPSASLGLPSFPCSPPLPLPTRRSSSTRTAPCSTGQDWTCCIDNRISLPAGWGRPIPAPQPSE